MHELLYRIYDKTGYYRYVSALPGGAGRRGNLDMLVEKAAAYEATSYRGVFHFIRYIEKLKKYNTDFGEAPVADSEGTVVRIKMCIRDRFWEARTGTSIWNGRYTGSRIGRSGH